MNHAYEHIENKRSFDYRIAMISIDNAVELAIKTYLGLPKRVRGTDGPSYRRLQEASNSFPELINLLEEYAGNAINGIELGDIEVYHRTRNTLYHDGNGVTVDPVHVDSYMQIATILLRNLLGISIETAIGGMRAGSSPNSQVGDLIIKWAMLTQRLRGIVDKTYKTAIPANEPILHLADRLVTRKIILPSVRERIKEVNNARNKVVHGAIIADDDNLKKMIQEIEAITAEIKNI